MQHNLFPSVTDILYLELSSHSAAYRKLPQGHDGDTTAAAVELIRYAYRESSSGRKAGYEAVSRIARNVINDWILDRKM